MELPKIKVADFEGPFDLLLHLIKKNKMDIYNIEIYKITNQYLRYLDEMKEMDLEITSEFIVIAATLIEIKSKSLLPKVKVEDENEEDYEKRIQKEIEVRYNRPEYNNWHKFDRHRGNLKKQFRKDDEETDESDGLDTVGDYSQEEERNNKYEYEALCQELRTVLKPEYAEVIIAVCLDELTPEEYAATTGEKRDTVYKRLQRAKKKIQEIF